MTSTAIPSTKNSDTNTGPSSTSSSSSLFDSLDFLAQFANLSTHQLVITILVASFATIVFVKATFNNSSSSSSMGETSDTTSDKPSALGQNEPSWEELGEKKQFPTLLEIADKEGLGEFNENRVMTIEELRKFDGDKCRMFVGVAGIVFDVQESDNFRPEKGYGKLWGGRDATYSLALLSLKPEDSSKLDYNPETDLNESQLQSLKSWLAHFKKKYTVVGKLKEYDGTELGNKLNEVLSKVPDAPAGE